MSAKSLAVNVGKLLRCGVAVSAGLIAGGMVATLLHLPPPPMPAGLDTGRAAAGFVLESPFFALALALMGRGLAGGFLSRAMILSLLAWVAYSVNTGLDASLYMMGYAAGFEFQIVSMLVPCAAGGATVAWLFPPANAVSSVRSIWTGFFARASARSWAWRLAAGAVAFMPIYIFFGLLVIPFTAQYYRENMYGLTLATWDQILPVLFLRSVLFFLACLPVVVVWQKSARSLFLNLGAALFTLVGLLYMLAAFWLPLAVRVPHSLEILADEFVYAGALVLLLTKRSPK
jgi:hypothetical protein